MAAMVKRSPALGPAHLFLYVMDVSPGTAETAEMQLESQGLVALVKSTGIEAQRAETRTWEVIHGSHENQEMHEIHGILEMVVIQEMPGIQGIQGIQRTGDYQIIITQKCS